MVEIQPIRVEVEQEEDGRILTSVPDLPGVMAYGATQEEAVRKVKSTALQAGHEKRWPAPRVLHSNARNGHTYFMTSPKAKRVYAALLRLGWTLKKEVGSHRKLQRAGWSNFTFCFHDSEEVSPLRSPRSANTRGFALSIFDARHPGLSLGHQTSVNWT